MKKQFNSWGILFLYLVFVFGLDRYYLVNGIDWVEFLMLNGYSDVDLYKILFSIGSLAFIFLSIKKNVNDKVFYLCQIVLGLIGSFFRNLWLLSDIFKSIFSNLPVAFLMGSKLGILRIAFTFIAGIGVIGLMRQNGKEKEER